MEQLVGNRMHVDAMGGQSGVHRPAASTPQRTPPSTVAGLNGLTVAPYAAPTAVEI